MKRIFSIATMVVLSALVARAQTLTMGGEVISPANMSHLESAKFAQTEHSFMTARVAAMGGAFTSLGADLSSMSINPAGMGMYRSSQLSMSMLYDHTRSTNGTVGFASNKSGVAFNQVGTALNLYQGTSALVSFTIGFGYNKLADLNFRNAAKWNNGEVTIGEFFAEQMYGIDPSELGSSKAPFTNPNIYPDQWGGVLAYRTFFIDPELNKEGLFTGNYVVGSVPTENRIDSSLYVESEGSVGEYDFSMGFNFGNILYLGTTLGVQSIEQILYYDYTEQYRGAQGDELQNMTFSPVVANYGSGVNFKIGAILRPISALRIGIAYHSPTAVSLSRDYKTYMQTHFVNGDAFKGDSYLNTFTYDYSSPSKLLLGASITLANRAIISVDWDRVWYDGMSMDSDGMEEAFANDVKADLGAASNFRVGVEVVPFQNLYLRGGYAYYGSPLNSDAEKYNDEGGAFFGTYKTHSDNFSLGLGWRFASGSSLDLAWTLSRAHFTNSVMYDYYYADSAQEILVSGPTLSGTTHRSNTVGATYSVLF